MPHQNRVTPFSTIIATPERGHWYGNRGCLHDATGRLRRDYATTRWIFCELHFKGWWRPVMTPGHYTGLFFLDEVTALAAGHRPCAECMRARFNTFRAAWAAANTQTGESALPRATALDAVLHAERWRPAGGRRTYAAAWADLPSGAMVSIEDAAHLVWQGALWRWSPTTTRRGGLPAMPLCSTSQPTRARSSWRAAASPVQLAMVAPVT